MPISASTLSPASMAEWFLQRLAMSRAYMAAAWKGKNSKERKKEILQVSPPPPSSMYVEKRISREWDRDSGELRAAQTGRAACDWTRLTPDTRRSGWWKMLSWWLFVLPSLVDIRGRHWSLVAVRATASQMRPAPSASSVFRGSCLISDDEQDLQMDSDRVLTESPFRKEACTAPGRANGGGRPCCRPVSGTSRARPHGRVRQTAAVRRRSDAGCRPMIGRFVRLGSLKIRRSRAEDRSRVTAAGCPFSSPQPTYTVGSR